MKIIVLAIIVALTVGDVSAQYKPADNGSSVQFVIKNLGFDVTGSFTGLSGNIVFDPQHLENASFDVTINSSTVNTDNSMRDDHLKKDAYFDVEHYPVIHFVSTRVAQSKQKGLLYVFGKLTIKGHTKDISFPFTAIASNGGYLFKGKFAINRKDFDIGGASIISDDLQVILSVLAKQ